MSVLFIKIKFSQMYVKTIPKNKVTVVLKLALLASQMDNITVLIGKIRNLTSSLTTYAKHSPWPTITYITNSILALLNL